MWVRRPPAVVAEVEDFLLRLHGRTRSSEVLGAWSTLAWLGGLHPQPPLTVRPDRVTQDRAIAEFLIAQRVSAAEPYPSSAWWAEQGCGLDAVLDPSISSEVQIGSR